MAPTAFRIEYSYPDIRNGSHLSKMCILIDCNINNYVKIPNHVLIPPHP
jgi:hypothetical protein